MRIAVFLGAIAVAFAADRPNLNGTWQTGDAETVAIHQTDDSIQITETTHDKQAEFQCNTSGKSCKIKDGEVSFWYNGTALVMMETSHGNSRVVKRRWTESEDGKTLNVEVVRIVPPGNSEKIAYSRKSGS